MVQCDLTPGFKIGRAILCIGSRTILHRQRSLFIGPIASPVFTIQITRIDPVGAGVSAAVHLRNMKNTAPHMHKPAHR